MVQTMKNGARPSKANTPPAAQISIRQMMEKLNVLLRET